MWVRVFLNNSFNRTEKLVSFVRLSLLIGMLENISPAGLAPSRHSEVWEDAVSVCKCVYLVLHIIIPKAKGKIDCKLVSFQLFNLHVAE